jgi:PTS system nitrogen regulatory IIA component
MILTLKELAEYLRVNERTVLRMLKSGQLEGTKIGGQWRFNGSQIDQLFFPGAPPAAGADEVPLSMLTRSHLGIPVSRMMNPQRMIMDLAASDAEGVLKELASPALLNRVLLDVQDLQRRLQAREKLLSTGVGGGIAVPHPRDPIPTLSVPGLIVFGRSRRGIAFGAVDGKPVTLFFMLCCQNIEMHLHLMGHLAKLLRQESFVAACRECDQADDLTRLVMTHERELFLQDSGK